MIEFDVDVDVDEAELLSALADGYEQQLEEEGFDCQSEGCSGEHIEAEIWVTDSQHLDGEVLCKDCNSRTELDIDDSDVQEAVEDIERQFNNLF